MHTRACAPQDEEDLNRAFGSGPVVNMDKVRHQAQLAIDRQRAAAKKAEKARWVGLAAARVVRPPQLSSALLPLG